MNASMAVTGVPLRVHNAKLLMFTWLVSYDRCQTGPVQCESLKSATRIVGEAVRISVKVGLALTPGMAIMSASATNEGGTSPGLIAEADWLAIGTHPTAKQPRAGV